MYELVIRGAEVITGHSRAFRSVAIANGRIAGLFAPEEKTEARNVIETAGCLLMPGLVDAHVHFREPGLTHKEDFESGSRAAALGGVTTVMVMPTDSPMTETVGQFEEKRRLAGGRCHVDFALQSLVGQDLSRIPDLVRAGAVSFEIFMGLLPEEKCRRDDESVAAALQAVGRVGGVAGLTVLDERLSSSFSAEAEAAGVAAALRAQARTGTRTHFRQISSAAGAALLARRPRGVTSEVTPHNLLLTDETLRRLGAVAKVVPPLRPATEANALRGALSDGTISIVATDHAPHTPAEKDLPLAKAPGGFPGVQTLLPLLLRLVADGVLTHEQLVKVGSSEPARIFGLYPRKGSIQPGADADLVLVDPARPMRIRNADQASKAGRTPFDGWEIPATPILTLLRGEVAMRDGAVVGTPRGLHLKPGG